MSRSSAPSVLKGAAAGALAGVVASFAMNRFQAHTMRLLARYEGTSKEAHAEPSTQQAADAVSRTVFGRDVPDIDKRKAGQAVHYVAGALIGAGYGIAAEFRPGVTAGLGSALGLGTAAVLDDTIVPLVGWGAPVWRGDVASNAYSHFSHLVFGVAVEVTRRAARQMLG